MKDIIHDINDDIDISNGDIQYGESTLQHQRDIILARQGDYRTSPSVGVGIWDYLLDERPDSLNAEIRRQLSIDGMSIEKIKVSANGQLEINAYYEHS